ncbi:MAG: hypothetical protein HC802_06975 [Caldilineaceae bacterium]|nr:hypothetical protein [Caldilineaceae bacterium]
MQRKHLWLMALLVFTALLIVACAPQAPAAPAEEPAEAEAAAEPTAEAAAEAEAESDAEMAEGACTPATEGAFAGVDPSGRLWSGGISTAARARKCWRRSSKSSTAPTSAASL